MSSITHRRNIRSIEAKRDKLIESTMKNKSELAKVRAELRVSRKRKV